MITALPPNEIQRRRDALKKCDEEFRQKIASDALDGKLKALLERDVLLPFVSLATSNNMRMATKTSPEEIAEMAFQWLNEMTHIIAQMIDIGTLFIAKDGPEKTIIQEMIYIKLKQMARRP